MNAVMTHAVPANMTVVATSNLLLFYRFAGLRLVQVTPRLARQTGSFTYYPDEYVAEARERMVDAGVRVVSR